MSRNADIANAPLSTRAKRALANNDIHTVTGLQRLYEERGDRHIKERLFGIGKVTAEEILQFLKGR